MPSTQSRLWHIVSLFLIIGGVGLLATGGWMFYQVQLEASKPPPAPILEPSEVLEKLEETEALPTPAEIKPTIVSQTSRDEAAASDEAETANTVAPPDSPSQNEPATLPDFAEDELFAEDTAAVPQEAESATDSDSETDSNAGEEIVPEAVVAEETTATQTETSAAATLSLAEAKLREEWLLAQQQNSKPEERTDEAPPSLEDNPLVVPEDAPAPSEAAMAPAGPSPTRIVAESIELDADVVQVGWEQETRNGVTTNIWTVADYAAGWHKNSALPGQDGNIVLSGHHNIKGEVFRYLVDLEVDEIVSIYVGDQRYDYKVHDKFIVKDKGEPEAVRRANARWIGPFNEERLTLVTCWPYNTNTHRLVVIARPL